MTQGFLHGHARHKGTGRAQPSPTYNTWRGMKGRCNHPSNYSYRFYGALGITYDPRWEDFATFLSDMGERPDGMVLDRVDARGNYEPGNCRWITKEENRRRQ